MDGGGVQVQGGEAADQKAVIAALVQCTGTQACPRLRPIFLFQETGRGRLGRAHLLRNQGDGPVAQRLAPGRLHRGRQRVERDQQGASVRRFARQFAQHAHGFFHRLARLGKTVLQAPAHIDNGIVEIGGHGSDTGDPGFGRRVARQDGHGRLRFRHGIETFTIDEGDTLLPELDGVQGDGNLPGHDGTAQRILFGQALRRYFRQPLLKDLQGCTPCLDGGGAVVGPAGSGRQIAALPRRNRVNLRKETAVIGRQAGPVRRPRPCCRRQDQGGRQQQGRQAPESDTPQHLHHATFLSCRIRVGPRQGERQFRIL